MDMEVEPERREKLNVKIPPASRRRADRLCDHMGRTLSYLLERLPAGLEADTLKRLPSDQSREFYLKDRLRWKQAFQGVPEPRWQNYKYPDPAEGEPEVVSFYLTPTQREQYDRYCRLYHVTKGFVLARFLNNLEKGILKGKDDDWRKRYHDGEFKKPRKPGPVGEPIVVEEPVNTE